MWKTLLHIKNYFHWLNKFSYIIMWNQLCEVQFWIVFFKLVYCWSQIVMFCKQWYVHIICSLFCVCTATWICCLFIFIFLQQTAGLKMWKFFIKIIFSQIYLELFVLYLSCEYGFIDSKILKASTYTVILSEC